MYTLYAPCYKRPLGVVGIKIGMTTSFEVWCAHVSAGTIGSMENYLVNNRKMTPKDWVVDSVVVVVAFFFGSAQLMITASSIVIPDLALRQYLGVVNVVPNTQVFVALALTILPLIVRRRYSWPVFLFCLVLFAGLQYAFTGFSLTIVGPVVAIYTIASERGRTEAIISVVLAIGVLVLFDVPTTTASLAFFTRFQNIAFVIAAAFAGYAYHTHQAYLAEIEARAIEAERSREEEAARRVEEERVRIAREVHDITAHALSAVSIQAAAAERLLKSNPEAAKEAIAAVRTTAKSSLDDIRSMIGVLRHGSEGALQVPASGTDRLDEVISFLDEAGLEVQVISTTYSRSEVPVHVDMALFGIIRESATNVVRHAHATSVSIQLACGEGQVHVCVSDNGCGVATGVGEGHGLKGMAERVYVLGGVFSAQNALGGGFCVRASIPFQGGLAQERE